VNGGSLILKRLDTAGVYTVLVSGDTFRSSLTFAYTIDVQCVSQCGTTGPPTIATGSPLPDGAAGTPCSATLQALDGKTPYSRSVTAGALPAGLSLNSSTGVLGGTPTGTGSFTFTVQVADSTGAKTTKEFTIVVKGVALALIPSSLAFGWQAGDSRPGDQTVSVSSTGGAWLFVSPCGGTTPATLTVSVNASGLATGAYSATVAVTAPGASNSPQTVAVTLSVTAAPPPSAVALVILQSGLAFDCQIDSAPPPRDVVITTTGGALAYRVATTMSQPPGGRWLSVSQLSGTAPGILKVSVDPSVLDPGSYAGEITISAQGGSSTKLPVRLAVTDPVPSRLEVDAQYLAFSYAQTGAAEARQLTVSNPSYSLPRFQVETADTAAPWLKVSADRGAAGASKPFTLAITADPRGLAAGTYTNTPRLVSTLTGERVEAPVTTTISRNARRLQLSQTGLTFSVVAISGANDLPQDVGVLNTGQGAMPWAAEARLAAGQPRWLAVTPSSGVSNPGAEIPMFRVSVDAGGLKPGLYQGEVIVAAEGADNSPHPVAVTLRVLAPGSDPGPSLIPSGLIFTGVAGATNPAEQSSLVLNRGGREVTAASGVFTTGGGNWLGYSPASLRFAGLSVTRAIVTVRVNTAGMAAGTYEGRIALGFPSGVNRVLNVLLAPAERGAGSGARFASAAGGYSPRRYVPLFTSLEDQFAVSAGAPATAQMLIVDDCGTPITAASVGATFTNRDRSLTRLPLRDGRWSGTWLPANRSSSAVTINLTAADVEQRVDNGVAPLAGFIRDATEGPVLSRGKPVVNAASQRAGGVVAPGSLIAINGERLAARREEAAGPPLPSSLGGVTATLRGRELPLRLVSESQIEAVVPFALETNASHQLVVRRDGFVSLPVAVAVAQPGIFTPDAAGRGQIYVLPESGKPVLATPSKPATAGSRIVILATGLGAVTAEDSPARVALPVAVTIGGAAAEVLGADVQPERPGVYLVTAIVPPGLAAGDQPVVVRVASQSSPPATLAVR